MNIFEGLFHRLIQSDDHYPLERESVPLKADDLETPCAKPFVDKREWFTAPTEIIKTGHQTKTSNLTYTATIFSQLTKAQFEDISQNIIAIHSTDNPIDVAHFYASAASVLNGVDPTSIVILATTQINEALEVPIGYAYITGAPSIESELRQIGVIVNPEYRNQGIAFQLFKDLLAHASQLGINRLGVDFRTENKPIWSLLTQAKKLQLISFTSEVDGTETSAIIKLRSQ